MSEKSDWLFSPDPIVEPCENQDCTKPNIYYLFHEKTKSVYKCCYACYAAGKPVTKKDFIERVSGAYSGFQEARAKYWKDHYEQKRREVVSSWVLDPEFYNSRAWLKVSFEAKVKNRQRYGGHNECELCHRRRPEVKSFHTDHIEPRSLCPERALDPTNLQVLCDECNIGKSNRDNTDFRELA